MTEPARALQKICSPRAFNGDSARSAEIYSKEFALFLALAPDISPPQKRKAALISSTAVFEQLFRPLR